MSFPAVASFFVFITIGCSGQEEGERPLDVVPSVDLQRYAGTWYEIARLANKFQRQCESDVTATYSLLEDGDIQVVNRCRREGGEVSEVTGRAKLASEDKSNAKIKVLFAPAFLSFLPFVWADYWIIESGIRLQLCGRW